MRAAVNVRAGTVGRALAIAATSLWLLGAGPALSPQALESVVSVLPVWPGAETLRDEPEGSGVAIKPGGYIVTNMHVLGRAREVRVRLTSGLVLPAEIVGRDPPTDLALIRIERDLPVLPAGPEPTLTAPVCAIGNQFGLGLSATCGVVSASRRNGTGFNPIEDFIQTDAAVNPGSSGGALIDAEGRLVGVLSAIFSKNSDANIGVNFASSTKLVLRVVEDLIAHGRVQRGRPGLRVADLSKEDQARIVGARIQSVAPDGAAAKAGLQGGDVVTAVGGRAIRRAADVPTAIHMFRPGETLEVEAVRAGEAFKTELTLGE